MKVNFTGMEIQPPVMATDTSLEGGELRNIISVAFVRRGSGFEVEGVADFDLLRGFGLAIVS